MKPVRILFVALLVVAILHACAPSSIDEYVTIPPEVPEELWGHEWVMLTGGGTNLPGLMETGTFDWLPGWEREEWLDVEEPSITWVWKKDEEVVFEYTLTPGKCVMIGKIAVQFTIEPADPYWAYDVSECGTQGGLTDLEPKTSPTPAATFEAGSIPYDLCPTPDEHDPDRKGVLMSGSLSYLDNELILPRALALEDVPVTILEETDSAIHISTSGAGFCFWWGNQIVWSDTRGWENITDFDHWVNKEDVIR